jgi:hypothetical protein
MLFCKRESVAAKTYQRSTLYIMLGYVFVVLGTSSFVHKHHPQGVTLALMALLPCLPILFLLAAMGRYLRDERDEFQRDNMVKALLWATAATLAVTTIFSFLRGYGWQGSLPPFTEFVLFFIVFGMVKGYYEFINRVRSDE